MHAPSVITVNAVAAAHAVNDYLLAIVGLVDPTAERRWTRFHPTAVKATDRAVTDEFRRDDGCRESATRGDSEPVPANVCRHDPWGDAAHSRIGRDTYPRCRLRSHPCGAPNLALCEPKPTGRRAAVRRRAEPQQAAARWVQEVAAASHLPLGEICGHDPDRPSQGRTLGRIRNRWERARPAETPVALSRSSFQLPWRRGCLVCRSATLGE